MPTFPISAGLIKASAFLKARSALSVVINRLLSCIKTEAYLLDDGVLYPDTRIGVLYPEVSIEFWSAILI